MFDSFLTFFVNFNSLFAIFTQFPIIIHNLFHILGQVSPMCIKFSQIFKNYSLFLVMLTNFFLFFKCFSVNFDLFFTIFTFSSIFNPIFDDFSLSPSYVLWVNFHPFLSSFSQFTKIIDNMGKS